MFLFLVGCDISQPRDISLSNDEYEIYATLIKNSIGYDSRVLYYNEVVTDTVYLFSKTVTGDYVSVYSHPRLSSITSFRYNTESTKWLLSRYQQDSLVSNYNKVTKDNVHIDKSKLKLPFTCLLFDPEDNVNINMLRRDHIIIYLSRVGFNSTRTEGVFYYNYYDSKYTATFIDHWLKINNHWQTFNGYNYQNN